MDLDLDLHLDLELDLDLDPDLNLGQRLSRPVWFKFPQWKGRYSGNNVQGTHLRRNLELDLNLGLDLKLDLDPDNKTLIIAGRG